MEDRLEFLIPRPGGGCALGCSALTGRCWSGSVWLYDDPEQAPDMAAAQASYQLQAGVPCAAWVSREVLVLAQDGGCLEWLSCISSEEGEEGVKLASVTTSTPHTATVNSLAMNCDASRLVSAGADYSVCVLDCSRQQQERLYSPGHAAPCVSVATHPSSSSVFATAGLDGNVLLWDTRQQKPARGVYRRAACPVTAVSWLPPSSGSSGDRLLLGTTDGQVLVQATDGTGSAPTSSRQVLRRAVHRLVAAGPEARAVVAVCGNEETVAVLRVTEDSINDLYSNSVHSDLVRDVLWLSSTEFLSCGWDTRVTKHTITTSS